jgi:ABC-type phosphate transport system auxiliary subunit
MGPTPREWLGAGLLAIVLVALLVVLVIAGAQGLARS